MDLPKKLPMKGFELKTQLVAIKVLYITKGKASYKDKTLYSGKAVRGDHS